MVNKEYDVVIIGAGVLGCFSARALSKYNLKLAVIEKREDVCTGISKSNLGVVYAGYDMKNGSLKAKLTVDGNAGFEDLCKELGVSFLKTGSLMVAYGPEGAKSLELFLACCDLNICFHCFVILIVKHCFVIFTVLSEVSVGSEEQIMSRKKCGIPTLA